MFLERVGNHKRACLLYDPSHFVLQQLNYLDYIDHLPRRIKIFHVKDAEFNPTGSRRAYGASQSWLNRRALPVPRRRAGRLRRDLLQDGRLRLPRLGGARDGECCLKHPEDGRARGASFIAEHIIRVADRAFDDFAGGGVDVAARTTTISAWAGEPRHGDREGANRGCANKTHRLGMVGGGRGAFIGAVHRIAARIDDRYELVAGALSSDARARGETRPSCIAPERSYADFAEMARREAALTAAGRDRNRRRWRSSPNHFTPHRDGVSRAGIPSSATSR